MTNIQYQREINSLFYYHIDFKLIVIFWVKIAKNHFLRSLYLFDASILRTHPITATIFIFKLILQIALQKKAANKRLCTQCVTKLKKYFFLLHRYSKRVTSCTLRLRVGFLLNFFRRTQI